MSDPNSTAPGKRIGQGMWMVFWVLVLAGLITLFSAREDRLYHPNQQLQSSETSEQRQILLDANRYGHYLAPGKINQQPVRFLLDTGATSVVVPEELAQSLGLKKGRKNWVNTANGSIEVYQTTIRQLQLGPIQLSNVRASINPHMDGEILLGMSALTNLELNQKNGQLLITQRKR
ncbi:MAG: retroviral-like aspartic protease family protein [Motiliproteus sp.]|nr:retroviral-like aspartic protease family protein [Motiliproteus sp.]MCW9054262.1 retroviral-like aspartic protease family protein [Motiliproteus sp.]